MTSLSRLVLEACDAVVARPWRAVVVTFGTSIGVAAFVSVATLTASANGQISAEFNATSATQYDVKLRGASEFPDDYATRLSRLRGYVASAVTWGVNVERVSLQPPSALGYTPAIDIRVLAGLPGIWQVADPEGLEGRSFDGFISAHRVAVVGMDVVRRLGLQLGSRSSVYLNDVPYTVVGVVGDSRRYPLMRSSIVIPGAAATSDFGRPDYDYRLTVTTRRGAAGVLANQTAVSLSGWNPETFDVVAPAQPTYVRDRISAALGRLFLILSAICLLIGTLGIVNVSTMAVMEREAEIGLRRAMGATRSAVAMQILLESALVGTAGGIAGTVVGVATVAVVCLTNQWTLVMDSSLIIAAPLLGAVAGVVGGLYPAWRSSKVEPVESLRS